MTTDIKGSNMPSNNSYGQNGYGGASSDTPGQRTRAPLTVNRDGADPLLERIKAQGAKRTDNVSANPLRPAGNMKNPNKADEKVPGSVAWSNSPSGLDRQPG